MATLLNAQALINSERPWLLITATPSEDFPNAFFVKAVSHGSSPAQIVSYSDVRIAYCPQQQAMPAEPQYGEIATPDTPIILVSGESADITEISKESARGAIPPEHLASVKDWDDRLYVYGVVSYHDLIDPHPQKPHETRWCFRYIPNTKGDRLVQDGPTGYNRHT